MRPVFTLSFAGRTEEALTFYERAVGAQTLFMLRFRDGPDPSLIQPGRENEIFHAAFRVGDTEIRANDVRGPQSQGPIAFSGFSLAIQAESAARAQEMFDALSEGGTVEIPLAPAAFTALYGIVIDRFGLSWKIMVG